MNKKIVITHNEITYTLEYSRRAIVEMERSGFSLTEITGKPMTMLPALFAGAFLTNHRSTKKSVIEEIYDSLRDKDDLISKLAEMYNEPILTLVEDPEKEGNATWSATW